MLNILILHNLGNPKHWRSSVAELELAIPLYAPQHNYIVHNVSLPLPEYIKELDYHGIILGPTFLSRRISKWRDAFLQAYDFIKHKNACKIALPQDEYNCCAMLDQWVTDWNVDKVYTVC